MVWSILSGITEQVIRYSTFVGQLWYVLTFVFRLIVVTGLGSSVYGDEQSNFKCNQNTAGCEIACYNQFTNLSHLRFWAFQLLAITGPVVAFHFLATYFAGQIAKLKAMKGHLEDDDYFAHDRHRQYEERKMHRREKIIGKYKTKKVFEKNEIKEIPINDKIRLAYFITTVVRLAAEGIFLYLTYTLYNYPNYTCTATRLFARQDASSCIRNGSGLHFLWAEFPEFYPCRRQETVTGVDIACAQQVAYNGHVPCWTSRAWEKTVFLRYMNIISTICFFLCVLELVIIPLAYMQHKSNKAKVTRKALEELRFEVSPSFNSSIPHYLPPPEPLRTLPRPGDEYRDIRDFRRDFRDPRDFRDEGEYKIYRDDRDFRDGKIYRDGKDFRDTKQIVALPLRSQPSAVYSTATHGAADYPSRTNSYYEDRDGFPERPLHPPPNETTAAKRYDEYKA